MQRCMHRQLPQRRRHSLTLERRQPQASATEGRAGQQGQAWVSIAANASWPHHVIPLQLGSALLSSQVDGTILLAALGPLGVVEFVDITFMPLSTAGHHERLLPETGLLSRPYLAFPPIHISACHGRWHEHGRCRRI